MQDYPLFSVIILNYNGKGIVEPCLVSVLNSDYPDFEVVLVDNASTDASVESVKRQFGNNQRLKIVKNSSNLFYTGGNNSGINNAKGEYIFVLNNDTEIETNCLRELSFAIKDKKIGAAQPKILIYSESSLIDNTGGIIDRFGYTKGRGSREVDSGQFDDCADIFFAGGTAMVLKREVLDKVGLFDRKFVAHWEDVDLSWRIRLAGYRIILAPRAVIRHKVSKTISKFGNKNKISFHIRKNRVAGLLKNYSFFHLLRFLPRVIFLYLILFFKELFFDRNIPLAFSSISALLWNIKESPYIIKERMIVQKKIRVLKDEEILKYMHNKSIVMEEYIKPFLPCGPKRCSKGPG